jgi:predicted  nucleic acid-binding Zn-ribbon protein
MAQEFSEKLAKAGADSKALSSLMAEIDSEKRSVKSKLSQLSSEPDSQFVKGKDRQVLIRRMKDKMSFLTEEREQIRQKLGQIKMDNKAFNQISNRVSSGFSQAFMAAAERILDEETFSQVEARASEIMSHTR